MCDLSWRLAFRPQSTNLSPVEPAFATPIDTRTLCAGNSFPLSLLDEAPLHLRDHSQDGEHKPPHLPLRRHKGIENGHRGATLVAVIDDVEHVARVAAQPVKPGDHQFIVGSQELDDRLKLSTSLTGRSRNLLRADNRTALGRQPFDLTIKVLIERLTRA